MENLWSGNTPRDFWLLSPDPSEEVWTEAYQRSYPKLALTHSPDNINMAISLTLGEGQYGPGHWEMGVGKRLYYALKPLLPYAVRYALRRQYSKLFQSEFNLSWPIEERYVCFQFEVLQQVLMILNLSAISFRHFWPWGRRFVLVLTHDIETREGQANVRKIADLEEKLGFRSSFNFIPQCYELDIELMQELRERGFEIGVHGLNHDGKLFNSENIFMKRVEHINRYLKEFGSVGFRAPLMMRNPEWLQALDVEYDLSFFDTDPYEPIPGGCMTIWPFIIGKFVELPYTLAQDCTLTIDLAETTPRLWLQKIDYVERNWGMALVNTHPDYLLNHNTFQIYSDFLKKMKDKKDYWQALPREVSRWWLQRIGQKAFEDTSMLKEGTITLNNGQVILS